MVDDWTASGWRDKPVKQMPDYPDQAALDGVIDQIRSFPPLVFAGETLAMRRKLALVAEGQAFLLQGGDCAESFAEFHPDNIRDTLNCQKELFAALPIRQARRMSGNMMNIPVVSSVLVSTLACFKFQTAVLPPSRRAPVPES